MTVHRTASALAIGAGVLSLLIAAADATGQAVIGPDAGGPGSVPAPNPSSAEFAPLDFGRPELTVSPDFFGVEYANDHPKQDLDIYLPSGFTPPYPLVIYFHGGGWQRGDKDSVQPFAPDILGRGFAIASVNYRLAPGFVFPTQIHDCKGAVRWLRANAATYDIDPDRFAIFGDSSGAHLASLLTLSGDVPEIEGTVGGNLGFSSRTQVAAHMYGATDLFDLRIFRGVDASESIFMGFSVGEVLENLENPEYADEIALVNSANPITYATPDDPPFYIYHGADDDTVPPSNSEDLADALTANFVPNTFVLLPGIGHDAPFEQFQAAFDLFEQILLQPQLFGDINLDGVVSVPDLLLVLGDWGPCPAAPASCNSDINGDGVVDVVDLLQLLAAWS